MSTQYGTQDRVDLLDFKPNFNVYPRIKLKPDLITSTDSSGRVPLHWAASKGNAHHCNRPRKDYYLIYSEIHLAANINA